MAFIPNPGKGLGFSMKEGVFGESWCNQEKEKMEVPESHREAVQGTNIA